MVNQLTSNAEAMRLFFTEDVYLIPEEQKAEKKQALDNNTEIKQADHISVLNKEEIVAPYAERISIVEEPASTPISSFNFEFLGKNEKKILILVNDDQNQTSTEKGRELLRKLVLAIGLTAKDFALVNYAKYKTASYNDLYKFFSCEVFLAFGVTATELGLQDAPFHTLITIDETKMVFTANLNELDSDFVSKKLLWTNLQKIK